MILNGQGHRDLFESIEIPKKEIWAVGGGKGGTGKSLISANIGVVLSKMGKRVLLVDADFGCANLHTFLGVEPEMTLSDFVQGKVANLKDVLTKINPPNLFLLSGARDILEITDPRHIQRVGLIQQIRELEFEYIILDLGAGTSSSNLDFFLSADIGILSVLPEPTSIENAYRFIKSAFYRHFKKWAQEPLAKKLITDAMHEKNARGIQTPYDLVNYIASLDSNAGKTMRDAVLSFSPKIVVNQVRSRDDVTLGFSIRSSCAKYFGIRVDYVGYIEYDEHVITAIKKRTPLVTEHPRATATRCIERAISNLLRKEDLKIESIFKTVRM